MVLKKKRNTPTVRFMDMARGRDASATMSDVDDPLSKQPKWCTACAKVSTRILGRRTAPFPHTSLFLPAPRVVLPKILVLTQPK